MLVPVKKKETNVNLGSQTGRQAGRQADRQAGRQAGTQACRQAGEHASKQAGRQASRQTGKKGPMSAQSQKTEFPVSKSMVLRPLFELEIFPIF